MTKRIRTIGTKYRLIKNTGAMQRLLDPDWVAKQLGAEKKEIVRCACCENIVTDPDDHWVDDGPNRSGWGCYRGYPGP